MTLDRTAWRHGIRNALEETDFVSLGTKYRGKVRDNYSAPDGRRFICVTDRVSAFDRVLGTLPFKGQVLNRLAHFWFQRTAHIAPNHLLEVPDPNVMICEECVPLPVEFIVRGYMTGVTQTSLWTHYQRGAREFCGHRLPDGLREHQRLEAPILTPSTKAVGGQHDVSISGEALLAMGTISAEDFDAAAAYSMALFQTGQKLCADRGLLLVDTKYEFGKNAQGEVVLIDEIHTPDSSRFWYAESYQERFEGGLDPRSLDKEYLRRWLDDVGYKGEGDAPLLTEEVRIEASKRYVETCECIEGELFQPNMEPPLPRMRRALGE
ncbi:MAG: phosphoribosylaminoimidazolesuccinocarboxamide synthase [Myxococcota bacterium]